MKLSKESEILKLENRIESLKAKGEIINQGLINKAMRQLRKLKEEK